MGENNPRIICCTALTLLPFYNFSYSCFKTSFTDNLNEMSGPGLDIYMSAYSDFSLLPRTTGSCSIEHKDLKERNTELTLKLFSLKIQ